MSGPLDAADLTIHEPSIAPAPGSSGRLVVLSANLKNPFVPPKRERRADYLPRLETFARLAEEEQADLILCQEVGRSREFRVDEWLRERLELSAAYLRVNGRAASMAGEEGLAIFSRYPLREPSVISLTRRGVWQRKALAVWADTPAGALLAVSTHHSLRPWRNRRQPGLLAAAVAALAGTHTALIGGDFNATENAPQMKALRAQWLDAYRAVHPTAEGATHELRLFGRPIRRRLDYLLIRAGTPELRVVDCRVVGRSERAFSDHRALLARLA